MRVMGINDEQQMNFFGVVATVLHLGNIKPVNDRQDQAQLPDTSAAEKVCHLLGINVDEFIRGLLKPKIKAGRDWVTQAKNQEQVIYSIEALARVLYERMFQQLVDTINLTLDKDFSKTTFIGVLDIAGFEIFEVRTLSYKIIKNMNINITI